MQFSLKSVKKKIIIKLDKFKKKKEKKKKKEEDRKTRVKVTINALSNSYCTNLATQKNNWCLGLMIKKLFSGGDAIGWNALKKKKKPIMPISHEIP